MFTPQNTPVIILADGYFGTPTSKLAIGVLRYGQWPVQAVVDATQAGKTVADVLPAMQGTAVATVPIVENLVAAMAVAKQPPKAMILGTAPIGGELPDPWRQMILEGVEQYGLHVINGLHYFLSQDKAMAKIAAGKNVTLWDVRDPSTYDKGHWWSISKHQKRPEHVKVITMVGSDCSVGKMFSALELTRHAQAEGMNAHFLATGQTGILISGSGVPLDRVIADYMAGYLESCVFEVIAQYPDNQPLWIFVEGQGSLLHPAYSGVTLGLLHGSRPDAMVLCHNPTVTQIKGGYQTPIPPMTELIALYETAAAWTGVYEKPSVVGISMNTSTLSEPDAKAIIEQTTVDTGLPATDPVRYGVKNMINALRQKWG